MSDLLDLEQYKKYFAEEVTEQTPLIMFHGKIMTLIAEVERLNKVINWKEETIDLKDIEIESLKKERDGLQLQFEAMIVFKNDWKEKAEKLEAENAELDEQMQELAKMGDEKAAEIQADLTASGKKVEELEPYRFGWKQNFPYTEPPKEYTK